MDSLGVSFLFIFLACVALPQASAISGPACARRNYKSGDCITKCRGNWGFGSHVIGQLPWGPVISISRTNATLENVISEACGFPTSSGQPSTSSTSYVVESTPVAVPYLTPDIPSSTSSSSILTSFVESSSLPAASSSFVSVGSSSSSSPSLEPTSKPTSFTPSDFNSPSSTPSKSSTSTEAPPKSSPNLAPPASTPSPSPSTAPPKLNDGGKSSSVTGNSSSSDIEAYLSTHNTVRAQHGAVDLTWSDDLATVAQIWASGCVFQHSGGSLGSFGENLAAGTGDYTIADGVGDWASEASQYDASNPDPSHFTQMVWKATTQLGCALVSCAAGSIFPASYGSANYIVCEYSPQGNVIGEFAQNVQA